MQMGLRLVIEVRPHVLSQKKKWFYLLSLYWACGLMVLVLLK
jgi:hypothetical protein